MTQNERPAPAVYLVVEVGLILGLAYFTFIGGSFAGIYLYGPRPISQAIIGVVATVWLASKFLRRQPWPVTPLDRPLLATLAAVVLATIFSVHPRLSLESALVIFTYALVFWFVFEHAQAAWFADLLLKSLFVVASMVCLVASAELVSWYLGLPDGPSWPSLGLGIWPPAAPRIGGLSLGSPNHLAGYLVMLMPLAMARGLSARHPIERAGLWLLGLLMLGLVGVSQSRGGVLGALGGLAALAIGGWLQLGEHQPRLRPSRRQMMGLAMLLIVSLAGLALIMAQQTRVNTARVRLDIWTSVLQMTSLHPLFGVGPGSFGLEYLRYRDVTQFAEVFSQAHNIYLHTLATLGVIGALAGGWLVYRLSVTAWRLWRTEPDQAWQWTRLGAIAGLIAFATHGLFDALFFEFPAMFQLVIILTALALRPTSSQPASTSPRRWWLKLACATLLCVLGLGIAVWSDTGFAAYDRAVTASQQGDGTATIEALKTAIRRDPAYGYYRLQLGLAYGQMAADDPAYLSDAITAYQSADIGEDYYALNHANLAWLLWEAGQREAAVREMARAVELEQVTSTYYLNLGSMLEETGQLEAAHLEYAQAVVRSPELLSLSFWDQGQPAARQRERLAKTALSLSQATEDGNVATLTPGQLAFYLDDWGAAENWLKTQLASSPNDPDDWLALGRVWLAAGNPAQALQAAQQSLVLGAPVDAVYGLRAEAHLALGNLEAAAADLKVVRFLSPGYGAHMLSGQLAEARGDAQAATTAYQAAIDAVVSVRAVNYGPWVWGRPPLASDTLPFLQRPALVEAIVRAYLALGDLYARQGMPTEARIAYEAILGLNPDHTEARQKLEGLP